MEFGLYLSLVFVEGWCQLEISCRGVEVNRVCWECLNFKGLELQKFMFYEYIVSMFNVVENVVYNVYRFWKGKGFYLSKFCKIEFLNVWRWKGC